MDAPRRAVIVGVNKYEDETIPELKGAINDATEVHDRLVDKESGGFEIEQEHFLLGPQATCKAIRKAISDLLWKTDPCTLSLFYFSGHGFHDNYGNGYLASYDIKRTEPLVCGIRMQELMEIIQVAKNKERILLVLDCCYSGIATEGKGEVAASGEEARIDQWFEALKDENTGVGRIILASSGKNEKSREILDCAHTLSLGDPNPHAHGAFTFHLLEGLDGNAMVAKSDAITLEGLRSYIEAQMARSSEHQPTFFGAGMRQADRIIIARASQWRKIDEKLGEVQQFLERGAPWEVFTAVQGLGDIIGKCAKLSTAIELKKQIDAKIEQYRQPATTWLLSRRFSIERHNPDCYSLLRSMAGQMCVDTILHQDSLTQALLLSLCEVSSKRPGSEEMYSREETFINELTAYSSASKQGASVAKLDTQGRGQGRGPRD